MSLLGFCFDIFVLGETGWLKRAELGPGSDFCWVSRMNDDARRRGVPFGGVDWGEGTGSTLLVLTIGVGAEVPPAMGRIITSFPSKVRAESLEFSSVSGVTGSVLTMIGYRAARSSRTHSEVKAKSLNSAERQWRSRRKRSTVFKESAWFAMLSLSRGKFTRKWLVNSNSEADAQVLTSRF